ncbi:GntP family permease [Nocardiopsis sp. RSe5-2]|uniref:GntP family permease n=1 Tax=Nocardiopsis endophytica TaxID=3018445 RepID=A0ABT4TY12_9ACTN|nr:GntP family permease [Nocardiopsis endophytica]MDA2809557.1 GntP family permease [Nocardiopsis endophytica]
MIDLLWLFLSILLIVAMIVGMRLHPAVALVIGTLVLGVLTRVPLPDLAGVATGGFGELMAGIGLSVGFGVILGQLLSDSGGARRIARTLVNATSERFAMYGVAGAAFLLSIPVFYDVTFVILVPLALAIAREAGKPLPLAVGVVALGAGTAHTLVPPTPNPLAAGEIMGFDPGMMLLVGGVGALIAVVLAVAVYSSVLPKVWRPAWDEDREAVPAAVGGGGAGGGASGAAEASAGAGGGAAADGREPGFLLAMLPLLTPILLIFTGTVWTALDGGMPGWLAFATDKTTALLLGVLVAYAVAARTMDRQARDASAATAVQQAGIVLLVTGAGGAFGAVIQAAGIGDLIADSVSAFGGNVVLALLTCYAVGVAFRVATGSGTVASITTMTIMASVAGAIGVHPVWVAMSCLSGALALGQLNDSGFWIAVKLPGFTVSGGFKTYTLAQTIASVFALAVSVAGALVIPMG